MRIYGSIVKVNDIDMFYQRVGEGAPLVLLHSFFRSANLWKPYYKQLSKDFELIVPDLRGHGRSTNPSGKFSHRQAARDITALLDELNIKIFVQLDIVQEA